MPEEYAAETDFEPSWRCSACTRPYSPAELAQVGYLDGDPTPCCAATLEPNSEWLRAHEEYRWVFTCPPDRGGCGNLFPETELAATSEVLDDGRVVMGCPRCGRPWPDGRAVPLNHQPD